MTPEEIIMADHKKNHANRSYSAQHAHEVFKKYVAMGESHQIVGKTMFLFHAVDKDTAEFHSINGGNSGDLVVGVNQFLQKLAHDFKQAVTYYDNPRVSELAVHGHYPHSIRKIDRGIDRTYELSFDLRGA